MRDASIRRLQAAIKDKELLKEARVRSERMQRKAHAVWVFADAESEDDKKVLLRRQEEVAPGLEECEDGNDTAD